MLRYFDDLSEQDAAEALRCSVGTVGPGDGGAPAVVADTYPAPGAPRLEAAFVGARRQALVVLDRGRPVEPALSR